VSSAAPAADHSEWWRHAVVYQVYPRSFADANGDGTGDVNGIRQRLPHLATLGVDAIWISPWYPSPLLDGGYDVADYRNISPRFGTLDDARQLIDEAHALGIRIIIDIVPNHTSWEHPWFVEAMAAAPGSPERNRYLFRDGDGDSPPTNWIAVFGGPAWTRTPGGQWYLHLFDSSQPDLNWTNPEVRAEFRSIFEFWCDLGVDGFRIDVAHGLAKDMSFPDISESTAVLENAKVPDHPHWDRDEVHDIIREWRGVLNRIGAEQHRDVMMVAEAWVAPESLPKYLRSDEYHQSFNFDFLTCEWDAPSMRDAIVRAIGAADTVGSTPTWALSNHDVVRHTTRYGLPNGTDWRAWLLDGPHDICDAEQGLRRARAATLLLLSLPGSTYLYQGEELGLPEVFDLPLEVLDDPVWENSGRTRKGRDGCRVPLPWTPDGVSFGFGDAPPWLPQPATFGALSATVQRDDPDSTLSLYTAALALRRRHWAGAGPLEWSDHFDRPESQVLCLRRDDLLCIVNFDVEPVALPAGELLLTSAAPSADGRLPGESAAWVLTA